MKRIIPLIFVLAALTVSLQQDRESTAAGLEPVTRAEMMQRAQLAAGHVWVCGAENIRASCPQSKPYKCDFQAGEQVTGIPYDWGGFDHPEAFDAKIAQGQAAGSHSRHGVTSCTTGLDCSGFISFCWKLKSKRGTTTINEVAATPRYNWRSEMKSGDAFNAIGNHIVLFDTYDASGQPVVFEASGGKGKVVRRTWTWAQLRAYSPLQYRLVLEDD